MLAAEGAEVGDGAVDKCGDEVAAGEGVISRLVGEFWFVLVDEKPEVYGEFTIV